jgi:hypothetical protein
VRESAALVLDDRLVDDFLRSPSRRRLGQREPERVAAAPEMEAALLLDHHREVRRKSLDRADVGELAAQRTDRKLGAELGRGRAAGEDQDLVRELARVGVLTHLHSALSRAANQLPRHLGRLRDPILAADHRLQDVVRPETAHGRRIDFLHRHPEPALHLGPRVQTRAPFLRRRDEEVTNGVEERRAELAEEGEARADERDLFGGRELLPHAAHRLAGRA